MWLKFLKEQLGMSYFRNEFIHVEKKKVTFYEVLVYVAYGYFILLGLTWFLISFLSHGGHFNYTAFSIMVIFCVQAYYQHRLTNLILGILALFFSIFMLLDVLNTFDLMAKDAVFDGLVKSLMGLSVFSIIMSIILIFSYAKLSFIDR